jgi:hypothetical protein
MKNIFNKNVVILAVVFTCAPFFAMAQVGNASPIEGGAGILIASGISYLTQKLAANKKKK